MRRRTSKGRVVIESIEPRLLLAGNYHLTFADEFDTLNLSQGKNSSGWLTSDYYTNPYLGGELQYYALQNGPNFNDAYNPFSVSNGILSITAIPNQDANGNPIITNTVNPKYPTNTKPYLSGELTTAKGYPDDQYPRSAGFSQQYGYFEIRAQLPGDQGMWPAFWLMPADGTSTAEYDIFETAIRNGSSNQTPSDIYQSVHWGGYTSGDWHVNAQGAAYKAPFNSSTGFHTYGFEWNPQTISWYVDGVKTSTQINRSEKPMYMLLNLAMGGGWAANPDSTNTWPESLKVDYVRVYSTDPGKPAIASTQNLTIPAAVGTVDAQGTTYKSILNGSFETSFATNGYKANPTGTAWTFTGTSGIVQNSTSGWSNGASPDGFQVGLLNKTGSISQTFIAPPTAGTGIYNLSFKASNRSGVPVQDFQVLIDGNVVGTFTPTTSTYTAYTTSNFSLAAGSHTLEFKGLNSAGGESTSFIDLVALNTVSYGSAAINSPTNLTATIGATEGEITLNWTAASTGAQYLIERRLGSTGAYQVIAQITGTTYTDTGLTTEPNAGGNYAYRVRALYAAWNVSSAYSNEVTNLTPAAQPPAAPANLAITLVNNKPLLNWLNMSYYGKKIYVERKLGAAGTWSALTNFNNTNSYTDTSAAGGNTYYYRVRVYDTYNLTYSAYSSEAGVTLAPSIPSAPTGLNLTAAAPNSLTVKWTAPAGTVDGYNLYRGTSAGGEGATPINGTTLITGTTYVDSGLADNTTYYYFVKAVNSAGTSPASAEVSKKTLLQSTGGGVVLFDDALQNGFTYYNDANAGAAVLQTSPAYSGTNSFSFTTTGSYAQIGIGGSAGPAVPVNQTTLSMAVYFTNASAISAFIVQLVGGSYPSISFNNTNSSKWTVDGTTGATSKVTPNAWHVITLDLTAFGANLTPGTTKIAAAKVQAASIGTTVYFDDVRFVPTGVSLPAAPTGLTASAISSSSINLSWTGVTGATGYNIYRGTFAGGESATPINTSPLTGTTYVDTNLASDTTYYYVVKALNSAGLSNASNEASATTLTNVPAAPSNLTATPAGTSAINLAWSAVSGATGYNLYRGTNAGAESATPINTSPISSTSFVDTNLASNTTYFYIVKAVNSAGSSDASNEASATTALAVPGAPSSLTASASSTSSITLNWSAASGVVTGYNIYRGTTAGGESATPVNPSPISGLSFTDTNLPSSSTFYYIVKAVNSAGPSAASNEASATTQTAAPAAPTNLTASAGSMSTINLAWSAVAGATGYNIYRGTTAGGESATPVNTLPISGTMLTDTNLSSGTTYYYIVKAVNAGGSSNASNEASATTPSATYSDLFIFDDGLKNGFTFLSTGTTVTTVTSPVRVGTTAFGATTTAANATVGFSGANGAAIPVGMTTLQVSFYYSGTNSLTNFSITLGGQTVTFTSANSSLWSVDGKPGYVASGANNWHTLKFNLAAAFGSALLPGTTKITNFLAKAGSSGSKVYFDDVKLIPAAVPAAPTGLAATTLGTTSIKLTWNAVSGFVSGYNIYRATKSGGYSTTPINAAPITGTTFTDTGLSSRKKYFYIVKAVNSAGVSIASAEVFATTL